MTIDRVSGASAQTRVSAHTLRCPGAAETTRIPGARFRKPIRPFPDKPMASTPPLEDDATPAGNRVVVMGVSGSGKSTLGQRIAAELGAEFVEGDEWHPPRNVALMAAGTPLTDADRAAWLDAIAARLAAATAAGRDLVVACSALKRVYRDRLRDADPRLRFIHLHGDETLLRERMARRRGHYMPASLLASQIQTLQPPAADERATRLDTALPIESLAAAALQWLRAPEALPLSTPVFRQVILETGADGRARFREAEIALTEGTAPTQLSPLAPSSGWQLRRSPPGFRSAVHCTTTPQWVFILGGAMEIGLPDGSSRVFHPGEHFFSADTLPDGAGFDPLVHGHWSRQVGPDPLVTLFLRTPPPTP